MQMGNEVINNNFCFEELTGVSTQRFNELCKTLEAERNFIPFAQSSKPVCIQLQGTVDNGKFSVNNRFGVIDKDRNEYQLTQIWSDENGVVKKIFKFRYRVTHEKITVQSRIELIEGVTNHVPNFVARELKFLKDGSKLFTNFYLEDDLWQNVPRATLVRAARIQGLGVVIIHTDQYSSWLYVYNPVVLARQIDAKYEQLERAKTPTRPREIMHLIHSVLMWPNTENLIMLMTLIDFDEIL